MKPTITLDDWRFEYLKDRTTDWNLLKLGGFIRKDDGSRKDRTPFGETVVDLQGFNEHPQFTEGFQLETESRIVVLGTQERWGE